MYRHKGSLLAERTQPNCSTSTPCKVLFFRENREERKVTQQCTSKKALLSFFFFFISVASKRQCRSSVLKQNKHQHDSCHKEKLRADKIEKARRHRKQGSSYLNGEVVFSLKTQQAFASAAFTGNAERVLE